MHFHLQSFKCTQNNLLQGQSHVHVCWLCQTMLVHHFSATGGALCLLVVKLCWSLHLVSLEELSICWLSNYVGPSLSVTGGALCLLVVSNYVGPSLSATGGALCLLVVSNYVGPSLQCHWRSSPKKLVAGLNLEDSEPE